MAPDDRKANLEIAIRHLSRPASRYALTHFAHLEIESPAPAPLLLLVIGVVALSFATRRAYGVTRFGDGGKIWAARSRSHSCRESSRRRNCRFVFPSPAMRNRE